MTREEAIESLRGILTEAVEFENSVCYVTEEDREPLEMAIKALEQEPCEDAISKRAVLDKKELVELEDGQSFYCISPEDVETLPPVNPQPKTGHCKECKYFEYDSIAMVDGIPLIVAHEMCARWGDGCKTSEDGYCFLFAPQESEVSDADSN